MIQVLNYLSGEDEEDENLEEVVEVDFYQSIESDQKKESTLETALCEEPEEASETPDE